MKLNNGNLKTIKILLILLLFANFSYSQNCYIKLSDATGIDMSDYQIELDAKACELQQSFPPDYQSQFQVFDFGFYSMNEYMQGGFQAVWDKVIAEKVNSPYYLALGRQLPDSQGNSKIWVELKIADEWLLECFDPAYVKVLKTTIKNKFKSLSSSNPFHFANIQIEGMEFMAEKISYLADCCQPNFRSGNSCDGCVSSQDVYNEFINLGFQPFSLCDIQNPNIGTDQSCLCLPDLPTAAKPIVTVKNRSASEVIDSAQHIVVLDGQTIDIANQFTTFGSEISGQNFSGFVSKNSNFCNPQTFADIEANYQASTVAAWIHVFEVPDSLAQDILFIKSKYDANDQIAPPNITTGSTNSSPPPPHEFRIIQRSFAPWDRFGHLPILPYVHTAKNSFEGDNRGFSLEDHFPISNNITSRVFQRADVKLGVGISNGLKLSSPTRGYRDFVREEVIYGGDPTIPPIRRDAQEEIETGQPRGFENDIIHKNVTYVALFVEGSNPLMTIAPDIEWY